MPNPQTKKSPSPRSEQPRLTRDDWLEAAHAAVVDGGFDAVRVLGLAHTLGVTRGSFYWHFADHAALVQALVQRWVAQENALVARWHAQCSGDARSDLQRLLEAALEHGGAPLENMRFELALRGLGRRDPGVAAQLLQVDAMRAGLFEAHFLRLCKDGPRAREFATLFYLAIVGSNQALSRPNNPAQTREFLCRVIDTHVIGAAREAQSPEY